MLKSYGIIEKYIFFPFNVWIFWLRYGIVTIISKACGVKYIGRFKFWESHLTFLNLCFLIYKMRIINITISECYGKQIDNCNFWYLIIALKVVYVLSHDIVANTECYLIKNKFKFNITMQFFYKRKRSPSNDEGWAGY